MAKPVSTWREQATELLGALCKANGDTVESFNTKIEASERQRARRHNGGKRVATAFRKITHGDYVIELEWRCLVDVVAEITAVSSRAPDDPIRNLFDQLKAKVPRPS